MLSNLMTVLDQYPGALIIILVVGAFIGMGVERFAEALNKAERRAYWRGRQQGNGNGWKKRGSGRNTGPQLKVVPEKAGFDASDQLRIVMAAQFSARSLLNRSERRVFSSLDKILLEEAPEWRAMCQVSLGEILTSKDADAFRAVNSKRVDFLIVDEEAQPLGAIEYQGRGHHQGTAAARDAVKKEALRRASIDYYEISAGDTPSQLRAIIQRLTMRRAVPPAGAPPATSR